MDVIVALEHRFLGTPDGATWTATGLARPHWSRYLETFDRVRVLARVERAPRPDPRWHRVDGDRVEVVGVPGYVGPAEYVLRAPEVRRAVRAALARHAGAAILRVPGTLAALAAAALEAEGRPFGVEVIADPHELFAPRSIEHPLRPAFRWAFTRQLRRLCARASAAQYVAEVLRARYPAPPGALAVCASDVDLADDAFVAAPRGQGAAGERLRLVTVGSLEQLYKAPDLLVDAMALLETWGLDVELTVVGDGRRRAEAEERAREQGVADRIRFAGRLPAGAAVRAELDQADAFVLPSRTEGMPRALLEAMARGLPCLATAVGGVPELLPPAALVPTDAGALAARIRDLALAPALRAELARAALARARDFHEERLRPVRAAFHAALAAATARAAARRAARRGAWGRAAAAG
jgi:glycosyltransferase involved in cell wall biosynthesis